jgi:hypothetical protein
MKKLYSILAMLFVSLATLSAQNTVFIGETGYGSLAEAVEAATDGATITIKGDQSFTGNRINITGKTLNFKGEDGAKIIRGDKNKTNLLFLLDKATCKFENLTFDGNNVEGVTQKMIEAKNGSNLTVSDCSFINCSQAVIQVKSNVTLNNVSVTGTLPEGKGAIFVGQNNALTVSGTASYSVEMEKGYNIKQGENLSGSIGIYLSGDVSLWSTIATGGTNISVFKLMNAPEGYSLVVNGNDINIMSIDNAVVKNLTNNQIYGSFKAAMSSLEEGVLNELEILDNITTEERYIPANTQNVTISGTAGKDIVITRGGYNKSQTMFEANKGEKLTFKNLTLSGKGVDGITQSIISCDGNGLYFENVTLADFTTTAQGVIVVKRNGHAYFNGTTFASSESNKSDVYVFAGGVMHITGDNEIGTITLNKENDSATGISKIVMNVASQANAQAENPSKIILEGPWAIGNTIVEGCTDPSKFTLDYQINGKAASLVVKDGNLVLDDSTGIEDIFAGEENGPVDVYNLQGVLLKSNVDPANATEGLAKGVYIIGGKKVAVY